MSSEMETLGAASAGALSQKTSADLSGRPCQNCGTQVENRFCPNCGQLAASFHRPIWNLLGETISDLFALDGRLARTLPLLLFRPGKLTKAYIAGQRARYVPPFRMFLLASLTFYLALFSTIGDVDWVADIGFQEDDAPVTMTGSDNVSRVVIEEGQVNRDAAREVLETEGVLGDGSQIIVDEVSDVIENPDAFLAELEKWAPRLSIILVPLTILALSVLHFWRRKIYIYDHAIHALHLHSWIFLTGTLLLFASPLIGGALSGWYFLLVVLYVWRSLVVAYGSHWLVAIVRLFLLLLFWLAAFIAQAIAAIVLSGLAVQGS